MGPCAGREDERSGNAATVPAGGESVRLPPRQQSSPFSLLSSIIREFQAEVYVVKEKESTLKSRSGSAFRTPHSLGSIDPSSLLRA